MKKIIALVLTFALGMSIAIAAVAAPVEIAPETSVFFGNSVYCEAGYENDVYNGVATILYLNEDGTFILVDNTSIIHVSYAVVTNWAYEVRGTYEVTEEEDGVKTIELTGVSVVYTMNGAVTTSEEDPDLLEDYETLTVECDSETNAVVVLD